MKDLAETLHDGERARDEMEMALVEIPGLDDFRLGNDPYDNSLEIYLKMANANEFVVTQELVDMVLGFGFSCFWVNYPEGTDVYCYRDYIGEKRPNNKLPAGGWFD